MNYNDIRAEKFFEERQHPMHWKRIAGIGTLLVIASMVVVYEFLDQCDSNKLEPLISRIFSGSLSRVKSYP